jgi:peptidoglycan/xylan/chitin deacetylase (PgdA/CDA1 family)
MLIYFRAILVCYKKKEQARINIAVNILHNRWFSLHKPRLMKILPIICLLLAMATGLLSRPLFFSNISRLMQGHTGKLTQNLAHKTHAAFPVPEAYRKEMQNTAQDYMTALFKQRYMNMWRLLHPRVQALWPGETAFASYWQKRFQHYTLQRFSFGTVHWLDHWVDPETMQGYKQVLVLPISLELEPDQGIQGQANVPVEDLHPSALFANLPFIVQRVSGPGHTIRWLVLDGGPADLEAPILPPVRPGITTLKVPILMYHHISDMVTFTPLGKSLTVTPDDFDQQLNYLQKRGYHSITFNQFFDALYYGGPLPGHPIILTFDDGYDDAYRFALPMLKAHGFSGMFYIITGRVGWNAYLNWSQIRTMFEDGMQIGSHTVHHVDMGSLVLYSQNLAQIELQKSQAALQEHLGVPIQQFCYPSGEPFKHGSITARQQIVALLAVDGYVGATTDPGMSGINQSSTTPFVLLRIRVDGRSTLQFFMYSLPW